MPELYNVQLNVANTELSLLRVMQEEILVQVRGVKPNLSMGKAMHAHQTLYTGGVCMY